MTKDGWKNRIVEQKMVPVSELQEHPSNWRGHPKRQRDALTAVLRDVGLVQGVVLNKRTGHLVDGHLRLELAREQDEAELPVTVIDVSEEEEALILATLDPLSAMATPDVERLAQVVAKVETSNSHIESIIDRHRRLVAKLTDQTLDPNPQLGDLEYKVIVDAKDEQHMTELLDRFREEGFKCKALIS
jgi:hypothetical protein